jgi:hypothetical protein
MNNSLCLFSSVYGLPAVQIGQPFDGNGIKLRSKTPKGLKKVARDWSAAKTP